MDPLHLLPAELDYELAIRGVFNLINSRQKTNCLRGFLGREEAGERTVAEDRLAQLNPTSELAMSANTLAEIEAAMKEDGFKAEGRFDCRSRLMHVIDRIKRAKPASPEEQTVAYEMLSIAESSLSGFDRAIAAVSSARRNTLSRSFLNSPLADALEAICATKQKGSSAANSTNKVARESQAGGSGARQSILDPNVPNFVPAEDGAWGGVAQQPSLADVPPPPLQEVNQSRSGRQRSLFRDQAAQPLVQQQSKAFENALHEIFHYHEKPKQKELPDRHPIYAPPVEDRGFEEDVEFVEQPYWGRQNRKTVPVHQWKVSYSGDGQGLHLYDFLAELQMFQRSEGVSDAELFSSVVHLLSGRARLWYRSWFDTFRNWGEVVAAMKTEFLPPKYDYRLLTTISHRKQKQSETFAEYLSVMQSMFKHLTIPVNEQHKLSIIEENILPKYALATTVVEIVSLEQLSSICRRVDFSYAKTPAPFLSDRAVEPRPQLRSGQWQGRTREVHEVTASTRNPEVSDRRARRTGFQDKNPFRSSGEVGQHENPVSARSNPEAERRGCYNCRRIGHSFSACPAPKTGKFCYRCGSRDVTSFTCRNCAKNGEEDSAARTGNPNPQTN